MLCMHVLVVGGLNRLPEVANWETSTKKAMQRV